MLPIVDSNRAARRPEQPQASQLRTSQDYDGNKYGLRDRFVALAKLIATKVPK